MPLAPLEGKHKLAQASKFAGRAGASANPFYAKSDREGVRADVDEEN